MAKPQGEVWHGHPGHDHLTGKMPVPHRHQNPRKLHDSLCLCYDDKPNEIPVVCE